MFYLIFAPKEIHFSLQGFRFSHKASLNIWLEGRGLWLQNSQFFLGCFNTMFVIDGTTAVRKYSSHYEHIFAPYANPFEIQEPAN